MKSLFSLVSYIQLKSDFYLFILPMISLS